MGTGLTPYYDSLRAAGKVYMHRQFRNGMVYDAMNSGRVLTTTGCLLQRNGLYIPLGQVAYEDVPLPVLTEFSVLAKIRVDSTTADAVGSACIFGDFPGVAVKGWQVGLFSAGGIMGYRAVAAVGGLVAAQGDQFIACETHWRGFAYDNSNAVTMTKNGVTTATLGSAGAITWATADGIQFGKWVGATRYNQMLVEDLVYITQRLSDAEQQTLIAELDDTVYESNNLLGNVSSYVAQYGILADELTVSSGSLGQLDSLQVSTGQHKMSTELYEGRLAKTIVCVADGNIILPNPDAATTYTIYYKKYTGGAWTSATSASTTIALVAGEKVLWATADGRDCLYMEV